MKFFLIVFPLFLLLLITHNVHSSKARSNSTVAAVEKEKVAHNSNSTAAASSSSSSDKAVEKISYPKKVISNKKRPTKTPTAYVTVSAETTALSKTKSKTAADVTKAFKDLPADDLEFIKELDKQFKLHGDKIKIKVEHDNSTESKNSKRTIEGELGYGHQQNGYQYERPKFMFYPYSQRDITPDAPSYFPPKTSVSIEPSYSYELKPQTYVEHQEELQPPQIDLPHANVNEHEAQQHYKEPVIVLRIPGPTKYASHLQTLLQQYLEIRAAQYLRILEDNELHQQQEFSQHDAQLQHEQHQHQLQHQQQQQQQQQYEQPIVELQPPAAVHDTAPIAPEEQHYPQDVIYAHQIAPTPAPVMYPEIDDVYQGYKGRHQQVQHIEQEQQQPQQNYYIPPPAAQHEAPHAEAPQLFYLPEQQYAHAPADHNYQNVYFVAMSPQTAYDGQQHAEQPLQQQPIYVQEEESGAPVDQQLHHHHQHHQLPLNENNPRTTHTKVLFTHNTDQGAADYSNMYPLPSIRPYQPQHHYQPPQHFTQIDERDAVAHLNYDPHVAPAAESQHQDTVAITQRPFNYHAHPISARGRHGTHKRGTAANKRAADQADKHFEQIREYVRDKLGAQMSSTVEFKTTEVVKA